MGISPPCRATKSGVEVFVRGTPNASKSRINGEMVDASGRTYIKIYVTEPPENDKANLAIIKLLSKHFDIPVSCITQKAGHTHRLKIFLIDGLSADEVMSKVTS